MLITAPQLKPSTGKPHNSSNLRKGKPKRGKIFTGSKTGVELRFYQKDEWHKLSQGERSECSEIRNGETK